MPPLLSVTRGEIKHHWTTDEVAGRTSDPRIKLCQPVGDRQFGRQHERHVRTTAENASHAGHGQRWTQRTPQTFISPRLFARFMVNNALSYPCDERRRQLRWRRKWASNHNLLARAYNGDAKGLISVHPRPHRVNHCRINELLTMLRHAFAHVESIRCCQRSFACTQDPAVRDGGRIRSGADNAPANYAIKHRGGAAACKGR